MSMGARELYMTLKLHHFVGFKNNNGRIFLSERDAMEEMGATNRESIRRWFRELEHLRLHCEDCRTWTSASTARARPRSGA